MNILVKCPNCEDITEITQINCGIFRHGVYKNSYQQLNPHLPEIECIRVYNLGLIYGCGKPFRIVQINGECIAEKCPYI